MWCKSTPCEGVVNRGRWAWGGGEMWLRGEGGEQEVLEGCLSPPLLPGNLSEFFVLLFIFLYISVCISESRK